MADSVRSHPGHWSLGDLHCEGFTGILHPFLEASGATEVELNIAHISQYVQNRILHKTFDLNHGTSRQFLSTRVEWKLLASV